MSIISQLSEAMNVEERDLIRNMVIVLTFVLSLVVALGIIASWTMLCIYWIIPLNLDSGQGMAALRIILAIGGDLIVGIVYICGFIAITD